MKEKIAGAVKANLQDAIALNDDLADHPELSGEEYESSRKIVELLKHKGFDVEYPFAGLPTSFKATYGRNDHKYKVANTTRFRASDMLAGTVSAAPSAYWRESQHPSCRTRWTRISM